MSTEDVNQAMTLMLSAEDEVKRCLAMGELFERLLRAAGQRHDVGKIVAAVMLLWRGDHSSEEHVERARQRALAALKAAGFDTSHLARLATVGRLLLSSALELQGEQLLARPESAEYVPEEGDLAIWLGKHVVQVEEVTRTTVVDGQGSEDVITDVKIKSASDNILHVSPRELELYHRERQAPPGDHMLVSGN